MRARVSAIGNAVAIDVEVAAEFLPGFELLSGHDFAAVVAFGIVPVERVAQPLVHADIEIEHHEYRRLQSLCEVERKRGKFEAFLWIFGQKKDMLGVAVRGVRAGQDVGLLSASGHASGRSAALNIEDDRRNLCEVGKADELLHERDTRA